MSLIVSLENPNVDCEALARTLMARIGKVTGRRLLWVGAVHRDTPHPHVHIVINGEDEDGKAVDCFRGDFLKQTIRDIAREICTTLVGPRSKEEIAAAKSMLPEANRYCALDKEIECRAAENRADEAFPFFVRAEDEMIRKRLLHLEKLRFARRRQGTQDCFDLERNWAQKLRKVSHYSSFLKARNELLFTQSGGLEFFDKETVQGTITKLYRMNCEESWDNAVVIENKKLKKAWFVPFYNEPNKKLLGAEVSCSFENGKGNRPHTVIKVSKWSKREKEEIQNDIDFS